MPVDDQSLLPHKASECPPRDSVSMGQPKNDRANRSTIVIGFLRGHCPASGPLLRAQGPGGGPTGPRRARPLSVSSPSRNINTGTVGRLVISPQVDDRVGKMLISRGWGI